MVWDGESYHWGGEGGPGEDDGQAEGGDDHDGRDEDGHLAAGVGAARRVAVALRDHERERHEQVERDEEERPPVPSQILGYCENSERELGPDSPVLRQGARQHEERHPDRSREG